MACAMTYRAGYFIRTVIYALLGIPAYLFIILRHARLCAAISDHRRNRSLLKQEKEATGAPEIPSVPVAHLPVPSRFSTAVAFLPDVLAYASYTSKSAWNIGYAYPGEFQEAVIPVTPGSGLSAMMALQPGHTDKPAVILTAGIFVSKYQRTMISLARRIYSEWGWSVLVLEMRDFADTAALCSAPLSASIFEGDDINQAAGWLRDVHGIPEIYASGYSYGASCLLSAASDPGTPIRKMAVFSPFMDIAVLLFNLDHPFTNSFTSRQIILFYKALFHKMCRERNLKGIRSMTSYIEKVVCPYYGLTPEDFIKQASPENFAEKISIPVLVIHPADDPVISCRQSYDLKLKMDRLGKTTFRFIFPSHGGHYANWTVSPRFTERTVLDFFLKDS